MWCRHGAHRDLFEDRWGYVGSSSQPVPMCLFSEETSPVALGKRSIPTLIQDKSDVSWWLVPR
jgi:hypothetical protein